jgi:Holliday junction resolvase RusA-like endonuclease
MTARGKKLKEDYQWQIKSKWKGKKLIKGDVGIEVKLFFGTKRKQDIDNFSKILLDAFTGIVWEDDNQIQCMLVEKDYSKKEPRVEVEVYEILK